MREILSLDDLHALAGQELGVSRFFAITQERISTFADATDDHQWIHVDQERCRSSPFGATIAHGFLTLSMLPAMLADVVVMPNAKMVLNYGVNKVRFPAPLPSGSRVCGRIVLREVSERKGGGLMLLDVAVEREDDGKPICAAEFLLLYLP